MALFSRVMFTVILLFLQDLYSVPRTILPHGASFHGHLLTLNVTYESTKDTFTIEVGMPSLCVPWTLDYVATLGGFMPGLNRVRWL